MIVIAVGHSRRGDNGAVSVGGAVSEFQYNRGVAALLKRELDVLEIPNVVLDEFDSSSYSEWVEHVAEQCRRLDATLGLELHFNSASAGAKGHEFLYYHRSSASKELARAVASAFQERWIQSEARRDNGIYPKTGGRGYTMLRDTPCPFIICEPFFGSNALEWGVFHDAEASLAEVYAEAICSMLCVPVTQKPAEAPQPESPAPEPAPITLPHCICPNCGRKLGLRLV